MLDLIRNDAPRMSPETPARHVGPQGLRELGYVDGQNVVVEFRSTAGSVDQLPQLIDELMRRKVNVILASAGPTVETPQSRTWEAGLDVKTR